MPRVTRNSQAAAAAESSATAAALLWSSPRRAGTSQHAIDPSQSTASSASLTSPLASSHAASEAESYAVRGRVHGVEDEADLDLLDDDDEGDNGRNGDGDGDGDEVMTAEEDEGEENDTENEEGASREIADSHLLQDSDDDGDDDLKDADSLADASPEEVEARALYTLGWHDRDADPPLPVIDLSRWQRITPAFTTEGTEENGTLSARCARKHPADCHAPLTHILLPLCDDADSLKAIQAELLQAVHELDAADWMHPELAPLAMHRLHPPGTMGSHPGTSSTAGGDRSAVEPSWTDSAFNRLASCAAQPAAGPTYPSFDRVQRATAGMHRPDLSFLDQQARELFGDGDDGAAGLASKGAFPWAASLDASTNNGSGQKGGKGGRLQAVAAGARHTGSTSLTREVGIITL